MKHYHSIFQLKVCVIFRELYVENIDLSGIIVSQRKELK